MILDSVLQSANTKLSQLQKTIQRRNRFFARVSPKTPIRNKLVATIYQRVNEICRELEVQRKNPPPDHALAGIQDALNLVTDDPSVEAAWHAADTLNAALPSIGSDKFLFTNLCLEQKRDKGYGLTWTNLFETNELRNLVRKYDADSESFTNDKSRNLGRSRLETLYKMRSHLGQHERARASTRHRYLWSLSFCLVILLAILAASLRLDLYSGSEPHLISQLILVLISGAIGATISRAIRIRQLERITELQAVGGTVVAQIFIGAALASAVFFALQSGVVSIAGLETLKPGLADLITIGLLSGFSEPFSLKILERIGRRSDKGTVQT